MSFTDFGDTQPIKVLDSNEETPVGNLVNFATATELKYVRVKFFKHGTGLGGNEKLQLKIYTDELRTKLIYSSALLDVASIIDPVILVTDYWLGLIRFEFDPPVGINPNENYYFSIAASNYTRNGDVFYLGLGFDTPVSVNTVDGANPPILLECFGVN